MDDAGMFNEQFFLGGFFIITGVVFCSVLIGTGLWLAWFAGYRHRNLCGDESDFLVTRLPRPPQRWSVTDFFVMFGMIIVIGSLMAPRAQPAAVSTTPREAETTRPADVAETGSGESVDGEMAAQEDDSAGTPPKRDLTRRVATQMVANAGAFSLMLVFLFLTRDATPESLSLVPRLSDFRRGILATIWILAPVLLINLVASQLVEYKHTVTDLLAERNSFRTFAALFLSAAIVTPVVEEFQFRLLLQGGLQKLVGDASWNDDDPAWTFESLVPLLVSSFVFALMHFGQGAAPIPLFFLAMGLGLVYQRTGRLWIVIVVHIILNSATICLEFCRLNAGLTV
ncbi:CPBP family intramembrane glutamic endopeptidase [Roseiconus lacunae]|uniref:CPBP family intramembrane glutamic endopeptidase n=1 Tax=Roseiconus lacunae TaxID=2605694 RepID=UPI0011F34C43|nr:CPBP family intramembrane glutamic endopeptidase [Roseiconus lacunae]